MRDDDGRDNRSERGAYTLVDTEGAPDVVLIGTGTETSLAVEAAEILAKDGIAARVVSAPSLERFARQDASYRDQLLPAGTPRVAVEAALRYGWDGIIGLDGGFVGMTGFGASAPGPELYEHFGITAQAVADAARERVKA